MQQVSFKKEGMQHYMVLPCREGIQSGYQQRLLQSHELPYILSCECRVTDGEAFLYYRLQYRTTLKAVLPHLPLTRQKIQWILRSIVGVMETAEAYLLDMEGLLWQLDCVFIEPDTGRLLFCYMPGGTEQKNALREVLTELMQAVSRRDEENMLLLLQFYNLVTEPDCTLEKMKKYVQEKCGVRPACRDRALPGEGHGGAAGVEMRGMGIPDMEIYKERNSERKRPNVKRAEVIRSSRREQVLCHPGMEQRCGDVSGGRRETNKAGSKKEESTGRLKAVTVFLVVMAAVNVLLVLCLLFDILSYEYTRCLFVSMGMLIFASILFMNMQKEESPDEIMQAYFEEQGGGELAGQRSDRRGEKWDKEQEGPWNPRQTQNPPGQRELNGWNRPGKEGFPTGQWQQEGVWKPEGKGQETGGQGEDLQSGEETAVYGETTVLAEGDSLKEILVEEDAPCHLYLESLEKGKYEPIHINGSIVLGCMEEGCSYILKERGISRMHAKLMERPDGLYLLDLNSTNGTYLNGRLLESGEDYRIEEGDHIAFAKSEFYAVSEPDSQCCFRK